MSAKDKVHICDGLVVVLVIIFVVVGIWRAQSMATFISLLALTLSIPNIYLSLYRPKYLSKPILSFESNVQYSPPTEEELKDPNTKSSWFLRLKIINKGIKPANNCVGRLIEVRDSHNIRFDRFDPFYLYWARQNDPSKYSPVDIQGNGDFFFLDIAQVKEVDRNNPIELRIVDPGGRLVLDSNVGKGKKLPPGIYHLYIGIYSEENVFINPTWFTITCPTDFSLQNPPELMLSQRSRDGRPNNDID